MKFLSVCSGIEAASVAWNPLGWKAQAFAEIEAFPRAVLAHHYPDTPNHGDMTKYKAWPDHAIDLLCGGTPCQSFSLAGLRKGLDDPRGNLMLTFGAIAARYRPRWLVWENVPGVLSSNGGADFAAFLRLLAQLGYGFAYRVLDAQYFGVAQRRRRVFVVARLGDWRAAAAVLFERHSLSGHPAPRRQAGERPTGTLSARTEGGGGLGTDFELGGGLIESFGIPGNIINRGDDAGGNGPGFSNDVSYNLTKCDQHAIAFDCKSSGQNGFGVGIEIAGTQRAMGHANSHTNGGGHQAVAVALRGRDGGATAELGDEVGNALRASTGGGDKAHVLAEMRVRRLTPTECERLQGFPDGYTDVPWRGKRATDGPRYKALGNSWAVPTVQWIGRRIEAVEGIARG